MNVMRLPLLGPTFLALFAIPSHAQDGPVLHFQFWLRFAALADAPSR
jgi:hypothetical protein